jgi:nitrate reductase gamma subunit
MTDAINSFLFGIYPYICISVCVIGSIIRFDREQYGWRSQSSQLLRRRQLIWGSNLFHVGILVIFLGHTGGLLTPVFIFEALGISHTAKQLLAMTVGGVAGVMCLIGLVMLLHRRLSDPRILRTSNFADIAVLVLLLAQLLLGLSSIFVSAHHLDGSEMVLLMNWAQHIVTLRPAADYVMDVSPVFKVHLVLGMTLFLIFPFTRLVHVLSAPVWYLGRRGYQIVRTRGAGGRL